MTHVTAFEFSKEEIKKLAKGARFYYSVDIDRKISEKGVVRKSRPKWAETLKSRKYVDIPTK